MKKKRDYARQIHEKAWYPLLGWEYEACCDCRLTHALKYRVKNGRLEFQASRDEKRTRALRKRDHILVLKG